MSHERLCIQMFLAGVIFGIGVLLMILNNDPDAFCFGVYLGLFCSAIP